MMQEPSGVSPGGFFVPSRLTVLGFCVICAMKVCEHMEYRKLQAGCLLVIAHISFFHVRERRYEKKLRLTPFDGLLALGILSLTLDGVTAWTVNRLDTVPAMLNRVPHLS